LSYEHILYALEDSILTITLNRPDKLNAYTAIMGSELEDAFIRADADDDVRVIVVTGAGRGFCAGADISGGAAAFDTKAGNTAMFTGAKPRASRTPASSSDLSAEASAKAEAAGQQKRGGFVEAIYNCRKPSIAAINGAAVGVGITLALPMDIRIASSEAKFGFVFARRGLVPEAGSAWFLPRLVGLDQSLRWCLSGRVFGAEEAKAGGLVSEIVAPDKLLARAREIATEIVENTAPVSIALTRHMLWQYSSLPNPFEVMKIDGPLSIELGAGADVKEGVSAFLEKRKPKFPGKVSKNMPAGYRPAPR
jgi:enoyl-CoA hydratase/carnithine racemase